MNKSIDNDNSTNYVVNEFDLEQDSTTLSEEVTTTIEAIVSSKFRIQNFSLPRNILLDGRYRAICIHSFPF